MAPYPSATAGLDKFRYMLECVLACVCAHARVPRSSRVRSHGDWCFFCMSVDRVRNNKMAYFMSSFASFRERLHARRNPIRHVA
jgi:hypothetical protein